ncbi:putative cytochrome P450 [Favolaschia claudopus]|uniref:Cytochrome P450 n=1 Tax=Favolaschia claudopus TaxID=2862362 RepID=A0AAV9ZZ61_9AGAR
MLALILLAGTLVVFILRKYGAREKGLPPGPPMVPLLGNAHSFPTEFPQLKFTQWARKYGGLYSLKIGAGTVVIITDAVIAKELLDKRGAATADRPSTHIGDLTTGGKLITVARYGETYKTLRKSANVILTAQATKQHLPIQQAEAVQLLHDFIQSPESFFTAISRYSYSVIHSVLYGKRVPRYDNEEMKQFNHIVRSFNILMAPGGAPPVDLIPVLKYIPERFAPWKTEARRIKNLQHKHYWTMLNDAKDRMLRGEGHGCCMEQVFKHQEELGMSDELTKYLGSSLQETGAETTSSFLQGLVLALVAHPEAQKKAQEEIDSIVGAQRMPTLDDLNSLPYVRALILEAHRFRPVVPLGLPHAAISALEYEGYIIPEGATIFVNVWGIFHDPDLFEEPEKFRPERYVLTENGTKPGVDGSALRHTLPFGFGRRICPGMYLAFDSININTMNLLWAFKFLPAVDSNGIPIPVDTWAYSKGIASAPLPFRCRVVPRSEGKIKIIQREFVEAAATLSKFEVDLSEADKEYLRKARGNEPKS